MANDIVSGLFGPAPWQIQQQQNADLANRAQAYAQLSPLQQATSSIYEGAGMLGRAAAPMLGMVDPAMQQAQMQQRAAEGIDTTSAKGLSEFAVRLQKMGMYPQALAAANQAREAAAKEATTSRTKAQEELDWQKAVTEMTKGQREKLSTYGQQLVDAGYAPGTPEFITKMKEYLAAEITNKTKPTGTNITMPKIEVKMGESAAKEIGPIMAESRTSAKGAVRMYDAAERIEQALATGGVMAGPLTTTSMKVRQFLDPTGGSKQVQETRRVLRALAESTVNARKALEGQGSITQQESEVAAKAESGEIDDMTLAELKILAEMNKRAARIRAVEHTELMKTAAANEATKASVPFYDVTGLEKLLKSQDNLVSQIPTGAPAVATPSNTGAYSDAAKEARYQAWKARQGK